MSRTRILVLLALAMFLAGMVYACSLHYSTSLSVRGRGSASDTVDTLAR